MRICKSGRGGGGGTGGVVAWCTGPKHTMPTAGSSCSRRRYPQQRVTHRLAHVPPGHVDTHAVQGIGCGVARPENQHRPAARWVARTGAPAGVGGGGRGRASREVHGSRRHSLPCPAGGGAELVQAAAAPAVLRAGPAVMWCRGHACQRLRHVLAAGAVWPQLRAPPRRPSHGRMRQAAVAGEVSPAPPPSVIMPPRPTTRSRRSAPLQPGRGGGAALGPAPAAAPRQLPAASAPRATQPPRAAPRGCPAHHAM